MLPLPHGHLLPRKSLVHLIGSDFIVRTLLPSKSFIKPKAARFVPQGQLEISQTRQCLVTSNKNHPSRRDSGSIRKIPAMNFGRPFRTQPFLRPTRHWRVWLISAIAPRLFILRGSRFSLRPVSRHNCGLNWLKFASGFISNGCDISHAGMEAFPAGIIVFRLEARPFLRERTPFLPEAWRFLPELAIPVGSELLPVGMVALPAGSPTLPSGSGAIPGGSEAVPEGKISLPGGSLGPRQRFCQLRRFQPFRQRRAGGNPAGADLRRRDGEIHH
jgi:hypothetical protein